jgi:preprotein translocase SecE subunit
MAVASLAGTAYALGALGIVFYVVPNLWETLGWQSAASTAFRVVVQLVVLVGLIVFGARLLGPRAPHGARAGIFVGLLGFLTILLLTRWASLWIEYWSFDRGLFSPTVGAVITAVIGLALLIGGIRLFMRPTTERLLSSFEDQGWFTTKGYKSLQGLRVRRGTIFGILVLAGAGIWTLMSHNTLNTGPRDWSLNVPFTGRTTLYDAGDVGKELNEKYPGKDYFDPENYVKIEEANDSDLKAGKIASRSVFDQTVKTLKAEDKTPPTAAKPDLLVLDRYTLQEINRTIDPATHVKIFSPNASDYSTGDIVERSAFNAEKDKLTKSGVSKDSLPVTVEPQPAGGPTTFRTLTLLPSIALAVPLLLMAASLWLAWRVVNVPAFADFLIATEAEMNKVSWTTQRRLVQDTIVVLVTVVLMAFYLTACDLGWQALLKWPPIGILYQQPEDQKNSATNIEQRPW